MDPDAALERIREILDLIMSGLDKDTEQVDVVEFGELVEGLDESLTKGGFLPKEWQR